MSLGLGSNLSRAGIVTPGIITDNLILKHNYTGSSVALISDGAAFFDGTDDYIDSGDITELDGLNDFTYACWAKFLDNDPHPIVTKGGYNNSAATFGGYYSPNTSSGRFRFSVANEGANGGFWYRDNSGTLIPNDTWNHIAVTYSNTSDRVFFYFNGVQYSPTTSGSSNTFVSLPNSSVNLMVGSDATNFMNGYVCNLSLWGAELTTAQIKSIMYKNYAGLTSSEKTNLLSWWNLDPASVTTGESDTYITDSHGSNTGTLS